MRAAAEGPLCSSYGSSQDSGLPGQRRSASVSGSGSVSDQRAAGSVSDSRVCDGRARKRAWGRVGCGRP